MTSSLEIESRTDTPERCDTCWLARAACDTLATISVMNDGTVTSSPVAAASSASCSMMATSVSTSRG